MDAATLWRLCKETTSEWLDDNAFRLSAALAYYTLFSMAPLLVVAVGIAGLVFGEEAVRGQIFDQLRGLVGDQSAAAVQTAVAAVAVKSSGILASVIGIVTLLLGSSAVFVELQDALNKMWDAKPLPGSSIWTLARKRLVSLAMVVVIGFLLLVSLALSAILNLVGTYLGGILPVPAFVLETANFAISFLVTALLFGSIFKVLPDVPVNWSDVTIGALATAAMFTVGKSLIGIYLGRTVVASAYGAAGSLVVLLLWIYYSALILFLGAEFTQVYARSHGSHAAAAAISAGAPALAPDRRAAAR
jgi:membrane protein